MDPRVIQQPLFSVLRLTQQRNRLHFQAYGPRFAHCILAFAFNLSFLAIRAANPLPAGTCEHNPANPISRFRGFFATNPANMLRLANRNSWIQ
jgi:hypothetical protein